MVADTTSMKRRHSIGSRLFLSIQPLGGNYEAGKI